jgi:hypothetical protein
VATLYRYYDADGRLLYVGQTRSGIHRSFAHSAGAWWRLVHFAEFHEVAPDSIDLAERLVIWTERPLFNRAGRISTAKRQAMRARLDELEPYTEINAAVASDILGLTQREVARAVRWGFLQSDRVRRIDLSPEGLRAFIGEDDDGPADPTLIIGYLIERYDRRLTSTLLRTLEADSN